MAPALTARRQRAAPRGAARAGPQRPSTSRPARRRAIHSSTTAARASVTVSRAGWPGRTRRRSSVRLVSGRAASAAGAGGGGAGRGPVSAGDGAMEVRRHGAGSDVVVGDVAVAVTAVPADSEGS